MLLSERKEKSTGIIGLCLQNILRGQKRQLRANIPFLAGEVQKNINSYTAMLRRWNKTKEDQTSIEASD